MHLAEKINRNQRFKRYFDLPTAIVMLFLTGVPMLLFIALATISTQQSGIFKQKRIGRYGKPFVIYKIKTMCVVNGTLTVTPFGKFLRKYKLDELPQLYNIIVGDMSFVGPRPDLPGYADNLNADDDIILHARPGVTGPATLKYKDEAQLLSLQENPQQYNDEVLWPDKVRMNKAYLKNWSFAKDVKYLWQTVFG